MQIGLRYRLALALIFLLVGCGAPPSPTATIPPPTETDDSTVITELRRYPPQGSDSYITLEEGTRVKPPFDKIEVRKLSPIELQSLPEPDFAGPILIAIDVKPDNLTFDPPAKLNFRIPDPHDYTENDELLLLQFVDNDWEPVGTARVDSTGQFAEGDIFHTSIFGLAGPKPTSTPTPTHTPTPTPSRTPTPTLTPTPPPCCLSPEKTPLYATLNLYFGLSPDPRGVNMQSGGAVDVSKYLGDECVGFASVEPSVTMNWKSGSTPFLRIFFFSGGEDTTLIMRSPVGEWICNDDYGGSFDPLIDLAPMVGEYGIWVGSFSWGEFHPGSLVITHSSETNPVNYP